MDDPTYLVTELYNGAGDLVSKHAAFGGRAVVE
jgi:hypothetical protein